MTFQGVVKKREKPWGSVSRRGINSHRTIKSRMNPPPRIDGSLSV
jgi:hypothetical protein